MAATAVCGAGGTPEPGAGPSPGGGGPGGGGSRGSPGGGGSPPGTGSGRSRPPRARCPPRERRLLHPRGCSQGARWGRCCPVAAGVPLAAPRGPKFPFFGTKGAVSPPPGGAAPGSAPCLAQHRPHRERALAARGKRGKTPGIFQNWGWRPPGRAMRPPPVTPIPGSRGCLAGLWARSRPRCPVGSHPAPLSAPQALGGGWRAAGGVCTANSWLMSSGAGGEAPPLSSSPPPQPGTGHGAAPVAGPGPSPRPLGAAASSRAAPAPVPADSGSVAAPLVFSWCSPSTRGLLLGPAPFGPRRDAAGAWSRIPGP